MIRKIEKNELLKISEIHIESFKNHFLPKLGKKLLKNYYLEFYKDKNNIFLVSLNDNKEIEGFLLGTKDSSIGRNKFIKRNMLMLFIKMLGLMIKRDKDTVLRVSSLFKKKVKNNSVEVNKVNEKEITVLSICVSELYKGTGVARDLINYFEDIAKEKKFISYRLTVHKENIGAIKFYEKNGMLLTKESETEFHFGKKLGDLDG